MSGESEFHAGSELADRLGFAAEMLGLRIAAECVRACLHVTGVPFAATENRAATRPCIRRETGARNRISQGECAENRADGVVVVDSLVNKNRDRLVFEDIETGLVSVQC